MKNLTFLTAILIASLSFAQVPTYVPTTGLVGWWPFNGNANDESGNGNNGTITGATLTADRNNVASKAYNFNGTSNFISINPSNQAFPNGISISIWAKINGLNTNTNCNLGCAQFLVSRSNDFSNGHFKIAYSQNSVATGGQKFGGTINSASGAGNANGTTSYAYPQSNWNHVVLTYNNSQIKLYVNGVLNATTNYTTPITNINSLIYFGRHSYATFPYFVNGKLDDIGIWNRALTTCEVTNLYSTPIVSGGSDVTICQGSPVTLTASGATGYSWSNSVINGQAFIPTTTQNYVVTGTINGCTLTDTVKVKVNPKPVIPNQSIAICSSEPFIVSPINNLPTSVVPVGTTYSWSSPIVTGGMVGGGAYSNQTIIAQFLTNITNTTQTATYTVNPFANGCSGNTFSISVNVFPKPNIPTQTITICSGSSFTVTPINNLPTSVVPVGTKYSWNPPIMPSGISGGTSGTNQTAIFQTLVNVSNTPQTVTYLVTPMTNTNGNCTGDTFEITVTVNPIPILPNQSNTICSGSSFTVSPVNIFPSFVVPTGTTYTWASPIVTGGIIGGTANSNQTTISQVLTNITNTTQTATYTVTPMTNSNGNCIGNPFTIFVTVNPTPIIPNQAITICSGYQFTNSPVNSIPSSVVPSGTTYSWSNPTVSGGMIGGSDAVNQTTISQTLTNITNTPQTATYTVTPMTNTNGNCIGNPFTINVSVKPTPTLPNQVITICNEDSLIQSFVNNPPNIIIPNNTLYSWSLPFNPGGVFGTSAATNQSTITQLLYNTSNIPQTATYTIFPISSTFGNCSGAPFYIYVTVNPTLEVSGGVNQSVCAGNPVTLTATGATTYSWNNNVINNQSFTPNSTQNYIVTGIDSLGCVGSDTVTVFVSEASSSSQTQTALDAYTWPVNNQTYTQSGTYSDTLVNAAGCDSIVTLNLTLNYTGINELSTSTIAISPNPTNGDFTLTGLELFNSISSMTIIDVNGKTIKEIDPKAAKFSLGTVKAGVYFLTISAGNKQEVVKIIKE